MKLTLTSKEQDFAVKKENEHRLSVSVKGHEKQVLEINWFPIKKVR